MVADPGFEALVHRAATILGGGTTVGDAARQLHVSERQLRTIFTDTIGLSPKHFARLDRLRAVLTHAGRGSWSDLAVAAGYYDQAHSTVEFRTIMGVPLGTADRGPDPDVPTRRRRHQHA